MALLHLLGIIDCECGCGAQECFKDSLAASYLFIISYSVHATGQSRCFIYYYLMRRLQRTACTYRNASCIGNIQQSQPRIVHLFPTPFHTLLLQYSSPESAIRLLLVFLCTNSVDASYIGLYAGAIIPKQKTYGVLWTRHLVN